MTDKTSNVVSLDKARILAQMTDDGPCTLTAFDGDARNLIGLAKDEESGEEMLAIIGPDEGGWMLTVAQARALARHLVVMSKHAKRLNELEVGK